MSSNLGSFSYIDRDYQDILSAVVGLIPNITPEWTDWNQSDIGITILQLFSGMAEMLAYTEDQHANQLTLSTCTQRESMINLTKSLAYTMSNVTAASVDLLFSKTPYTTTSAGGTLADNITAGISTFTISNYTGFAEKDVIYLDNGTNNEYVIIDYFVIAGSNTTVNIKGVTRYAYTSDTGVSRIPYTKNVIIPDNFKCSTSGTTPVYFETIANIDYTIYAGSTYIDQTVILGFDTAVNTITVANAYDYSSEETLYLKSSIFSNASMSLVIASVSGRVITLSTALPSWTSINDIISRMVPSGQGVTRTETLAPSTGLPSQYRDITYTPIIDTSIVVEINEGSTYETWTEVTSFFSSDSNDPHYTFQILATGRGRIIFGDGINGKIPALNSAIKTSYVQGGGTAGNVGKNTITKVSSSISDEGGSVVSLTVNNPDQASGGEEKESLDIARVRAPALYAATYRALSSSDFEALSTGFSDAAYGTIANSKVVESLVDNAVSIYVWAADSNGFATTTSSGLKLALKNYLLTKAAAGYLVSIVDGYTTSIAITATVYVLTGNVQAVVRTNVLTAINSLFQVENLEPSDDFYLGNLYEAIEAVSGVDRVDITQPTRPGVSISNLHMPIKGTVLLTMVGGD